VSVRVCVRGVRTRGLVEALLQLLEPWPPHVQDGRLQGLHLVGVGG
jgi:hypothetical protein